MKKTDDLYKLLGVKKTATELEIKEAFRDLAKELHPDRNPSKSAEERFKAITAAHEVLADPKRRAEYDRGGPVVIKSRVDSYTVEELHCGGDVANIYRAKDSTGKQVALKIARFARDNDLLENEANVLRTVRPPKEAEVGRMRYFPTLVDSFKINDGRTTQQVVVTKWLHGFYTLRDVVRKNKNLRFEHVVWMFNRTLEGLAFIHKAGFVHGGISPTNLMVFGAQQVSGLKDLYDHGVKIIDFTSAVPIGTPIKILAPSVKPFLPPEVAAKRPATPATDIAMAAACARFASYSCPEWPKYLQRFIQGCLIANQDARPQDAGALHKEFKDHMREHYGPKKYFPFEMPQHDA